MIELMIVIGIISIISSISLPALLNSEHKARKAARGLMGDIQKARTLAVKQNKEFAIVFQPASNDYLICSDSGADNDWSVTADNTISKTVSLTTYATGVQYGHGSATVPVGADFGDEVTYDPPDNVLTLSPRGITTPGYVYLAYSDAAYAVGTSSTGNIHIRRWTGGSWK